MIQDGMSRRSCRTRQTSMWSWWSTRRLTQTPALNAAFESLATARADMTIDLDAAYRSLLATRQALELTADHRRVRETNTSETAFG